LKFRLKLNATPRQSWNGFSRNTPGQTGIDWFMALDDAFGSLAEFPERCPIAPESARFPFEVRQLLYGRKPHLYRILFTIQLDTVYVLHIRHGRRKRVAPSE